MIWFAWYANHVDRQDDEWLKIDAKTRGAAKEIAIRHLNNRRFSLSWVKPLKEVRKIDPGIVRLERHNKGVSE